MSTTPTLGLFKHDNPATNTNAFDVQEALNDNWDKIDDGFGDIVKHFNSVAEMKIDEKLQIGDVCQTLGYYSANDGGAGLYKIVDDDTLVDDGGSIHELENGLKAELIYTYKLKPEQFGAKGDGITDDSSVITKLANFIEIGLNGNGIISFSSQKKYRLKVTIPYVNIEGNNAVIVNDFENSHNYAMHFTGSNIRGHIIRDLKFNCNGTNISRGFNGIYAENLREQKFENIYIENINEYGIYVDSGFGGTFENCYIQGVINTQEQEYTPYGIGICLKTSDCIVNNLTIVNTHIGLEDRGLNIVNGLHIWIAATDYANKSGSIGIYKKNHGMYNNIYIDSLQYGFYIEDSLNLKVNNIHWLIKDSAYTSYLVYNNTNYSLRGINLSNINLSNASNGNNFFTFNKGAISVSNFFSLDNTQTPLAYPDIEVTINQNLNVERKQINIINDFVYINLKATATANISANSSLLQFAVSFFTRPKYCICYINKQPVEFYVSNQIYNTNINIEQGDEVIIDIVVPKV